MTQAFAIHYDIALSIQPEEYRSWQKLYGGTIQVDCSIAIQNASSQALPQISLMLYRLLRVNSVCDEDGVELNFVEKVVELQVRPLQQVNAVQINLRRPIEAGETTQIRIKYHGAICGYVEVFPYVQDHVSERYSLLRTETLWHPVVGDPINGFPEKPFDFNLSVVVPKGLIVLANGRLTAKSERDGLAQYDWLSDQPEAWGHLTVACAQFREMALAPNVNLYYLEEDEIGAQVVAKAVERTIARCTQWFGVLPDRALNIVEIPEGYGSEASPTLILQTADTFRAGSVNDHEAYRQALSWAGHEVIHLWNAPSREERVSRFLDESVTHYIEAYLLKEEINESAYWDRMERYRRLFLSGGEDALRVPLAQAGNHLEARDEIARGKGPWSLCVLHRLIGDQFILALKNFFDEHRIKGALLNDFQKTIPEVAGVDLQNFFQDWFWTANSSIYLRQENSPQMLVEEIAAKYTDYKHKQANRFR